MPSPRFIDTTDWIRFPRYPILRPLVLLGNHPTGILEQLRPSGWKILSNRFARATPEFGERAIPLDPFGLESDPRVNTRGFAAALRHLRSGGAIGAFPAGRVTPANGPDGMLQDSAWSPHLIRHYLTLGATFHAFHREASFGDAIYCLLDVRLEQLPPAHRKRFLGNG